MGMIYPGIPVHVAEFMQKTYQLDTFVETGTYMADTAVSVSKFFKKVYTIELSEGLYTTAKNKYKHIKNIDFLQGSASLELSRLLSSEFPPSLFWLDAHWSGGVTAGENIPCTLLDEIDIILRSNKDHVILIDDARIMLVPPPVFMRRPDYLPAYSEVTDVLNSIEKRYSIIWRDIVISVPLSSEESLYHYLNSQKDVNFWSRGDLFAHEEYGGHDFAHEGLGLVLRCWKKALLGSLYLPGAFYRSVKAKL
ncbi:MAG: hypothetical protein LBS53_14750 [Synergistaceae bacterium]|jgi:hypothetical protein|nr:hypothetical protein [Synergistaceae bacterium]